MRRVSARLLATTPIPEPAGAADFTGSGAGAATVELAVGSVVGVVCAAGSDLQPARSTSRRERWSRFTRASYRARMHSSTRAATAARSARVGAGTATRDPLADSRCGRGPRVAPRVVDE